MVAGDLHRSAVERRTSVTGLGPLRFNNLSTRDGCHRVNYGHDIRMGPCPELLREPHRVPAPRAVARAGRDRSRVPPPASRATRSRPLVARAGPGGRARARRARVKVESSRLGLPSFKILGASWAIYRLLVDRLGTSPSGRPRRAPRRARPARPAHARRRDRRQPRPRRRPHGPPARLRARILVPAGTAAARIAGIESEGATVDGGRRHLRRRGRARRPRSRPTTCSSCRTRRGRATPTSPRRDRGIRHDLRRGRRAARRRAPDLVVVPMGVGALTAAVVAHYSAARDRGAVEPLARGVRAALGRGRPPGRSCPDRTTRSWPGSTAAPSR